MADYDYANARLRAMKSRLLSRPALEGLVEAGSVQGLVTALANTAYRQAIEAALARHVAEVVGMECLTQALHYDLIATVGKVQYFFDKTDGGGELAAVVLRRYDLHNVKTVLRGLAQHIPANEILANTLPVAELRAADLAELAGAANINSAIDLLATWRLVLARPLLELRARGPSVEVSAMELALDRTHSQTAIQVARAAEEEGRLLLEALSFEADLTNILTALRLIGVAETTAMLRKHFAADSLEALFVGPGHLSVELLVGAARRDSVTEALTIFAATPYGALLMSSLPEFLTSSRLSVFEQVLVRQQLRHAYGLFTRDPLGIGVLVGYVALKTNEISNLRAIGLGLVQGERPDRIRAELMTAAI